MNLVADIKAELHKTITKLWPSVDIPEIVVITPPKEEFGDYSCAVALSLAKVINGSPMQVAQQLKQKLGKMPFVDNVTLTEPGFVNFNINYPKLVEKLLDKNLPRPKPKSLKISVEHTSVNPNKAAHIGHLRNACLGDSFARLAKLIGHQVEVQNYIDDLGVQVADSVVAFETLGDAPEDIPIDKWMWQIYADISTKYEGNPKLLARRDEVLHEMERGESQTAKKIVKAMVAAQLRTFKRFDINYDLLVYETDIIKNKLWDSLFTELKTKKLIAQATSGDNQGAWLVEFGETERENKILVRSNGLPTYTAKDLAYYMWKFGIFEMPGYKRILKQVDEVVNVVDERQTYPLAVVKHMLAQLGYTKEAQHAFHLAYGVVKLSAKAVEQLGKSQGNKSLRPASMSGRAGIGIMADDLLDTALALQTKRFNTPQKTAEQIAMGSIRYYMLKARPQREIVFDFDEALQTDGNTGVYLQYAYARANNILDKGSAHTPSPSSLTNLNKNERRLAKTLAEKDQVLAAAFREYDPSQLCDYAYELASTFAKFYETSPVLQAKPDIQSLRLGLVRSYLNTLREIMECLGIPTLPKI
ncbi:MAG: arginine--tRNA ligase [Patescibacteria group bacterium]|nr:arginine--tRNA ligase [Patescibacteria group bacterium]